MIKRITLGLLSVALLSIGCLGTPAVAQSVLYPGGDNYGPNVGIVGISNATAGYTNATTTYTDIPNATISLLSVNGDFAKQYIEACWWADATKATATTGTIQVMVNGVAQTASRRSIASSAGQSSPSLCYTVVRPVAASLVVKLQGVSGDTNTFTVANAVLKVSLIRLLK